MQRILPDLKKGVPLSGEVYEPLNKLLKPDEENGSGDSQLLCELFSGEKTSYRFATVREERLKKTHRSALLEVLSYSWQQKSSEEWIKAMD